MQGRAPIVGKDGKFVGNPMAPSFGGSASGLGTLSPFKLKEGRTPKGDDEVVIDAATARNESFAIGDQVRIDASQTGTYTLVGIVGFGSADNLAGATFVLWEMPTAQRVLHRLGEFDEIAVKAKEGAPGRSSWPLAAGPAQGLEAVTSDLAAEQAAGDVKDALGFFNTFLLAFAAVALFVGSFIIFNTFTIIVAQRLRGARPAPGTRRQPEAGDPVGAGRGAHRRLRGLGHRGRRRCRRGCAVEGAPRRLRHGPAVAHPGHQAPHGDRPDDRRGADHDAGVVGPGPEGVEGAAGGSHSGCRGDPGGPHAAAADHRRRCRARPGDPEPGRGPLRRRRDRPGGPRRAHLLRRGGHAVSAGRRAAVAADRGAGRPLPRHAWPARAAQRHAQPPPHGVDRRRADDRARARRVS